MRMTITTQANRVRLNDASIHTARKLMDNASGNNVGVVYTCGVALRKRLDTWTYRRIYFTVLGTCIDHHRTRKDVVVLKMFGAV